MRSSITLKIKKYFFLLPFFMLIIFSLHNNVWYWLSFSLKKDQIIQKYVELNVYTHTHTHRIIISYQSFLGISLSIYTSSHILLSPKIHQLTLVHCSATCSVCFLNFHISQVFNRSFNVSTYTGTSFWHSILNHGYNLPSHPLFMNHCFSKNFISSFP